MKTIKFLLLILFTSTLSIQAQHFYADNNIRGIRNEEPNVISEKKDVEKKEYKWEFISGTPSSFDDNTIKQAEDHEFGEKVACLKVLMDKYYITKEEIVPGDPMMRTIIKKPNVYNTTRKIEKFLRKEVSKGKMDISKAKSEYTHVLEVAIALLEEDSHSFEKSLDSSKKDIDQQLTLFNQVKLNSLY